MTYVDGFVAAVPNENKEAYRQQAAGFTPLFREMGVRRQVECWGDDVPHGKLTDFYGAVQAKDDETVVFAWVVYASRADRDAILAKVMADPRMRPDMSTMPFDGKRMIYGGFETFMQL